MVVGFAEGGGFWDKSQFNTKSAAKLISRHYFSLTKALSRATCNTAPFLDMLAPPRNECWVVYEPFNVLPACSTYSTFLTDTKRLC